jgi:ImpA, N-terminal, type VI secretion system
MHPLEERLLMPIDNGVGNPSKNINEWIELSHLRPMDHRAEDADYKEIARLCQEILSKHCKDLTVAAWLTEAWAYEFGLDGIRNGLDIIVLLCDKFGSSLYPRHDEFEKRFESFSWMNNKLCDVINSIESLALASNLDQNNKNNNNLIKEIKVLLDTLDVFSQQQGWRGASWFSKLKTTLNEMEIREVEEQAKNDRKEKYGLNIDQNKEMTQSNLVESITMIINKLEKDNPLHPSIPLLKKAVSWSNGKWSSWIDDVCSDPELPFDKFMLWLKK